MLFALLFAALSAAQYTFPLPPGPYGVSIKDALVTDYERSDPLSDLPYRCIPVSIISPTGSSVDCEPIVQPYMPNLTARYFEEGFNSQYGLPFNGTFSQTQSILCKYEMFNASTPVILLAPAAGTSRLFYNALGSAIVAETGYTVVTYESPGLPLVSQFPDGSVQFETNEIITNDEAYAILAQDASSILNLIFNNTNMIKEGMANVTVKPPLPQNLLNVTHIAIAGHSQGGGSSTLALLADPRLAGGINLDGFINATQTGVVACTDSNTTLHCVSDTIVQPYMLIQHDGHNQSVGIGWADLWADTLRGPKWQIQLHGSEHATYGDFPYLLDLYGIRQEVNPELVDLVAGSVSGAVVFEVLSKLFHSFFEFCFDGNETGARDVTAAASELATLGLEIVNHTIASQ